MFGFLKRLRHRIGLRREDTDLQRELEAYVELETERLSEEGLDSEAARYRAIRELGNTRRIRETTYEMQLVALLDRWFRDLRLAFRALRRNPTFTLVAVFSLALGIGANTAIFTVADQVLIRPLSVQDPDALFSLRWDGEFRGMDAGGSTAFSYPAYLDLAASGIPGVRGLAARYQQGVSIEADSSVESAVAEFVSGNYFQVLDVGATLGRTLVPEDDEEWDAEPYAVLSERYWTARFGRDPDVLGQTVRVDGIPMNIVGVASNGFSGFDMLDPADIFMTLKMEPIITGFDVRERRDAIWLRIIGRRNGDLDLDAIENAMASSYLDILRTDIEVTGANTEYSEIYLRNTLQLTRAAGGVDSGRTRFRNPIYVLVGLVGGLFLIACVNVANLLIARSAQRTREIAVRSALGASRGALIGLILAESLVLAIAAGAVGLLFSAWTTSFLLGMLPPDSLGRVVDATPDWRILGFAVVLCLATTLLSGVGPALHASAAGRSVTHLHQAASRASARRESAGVRRLLVGAQVALSLALLVGAGLFTESLRNLFEVDTGMRSDRVLAFAVHTSHIRRPWGERLQFVHELQDRLRQEPGIIDATASIRALMAGDVLRNTINVEGYEPSESENMRAGWNVVLPGFLSTVGVPLLAGRDFTRSDAAGAPFVVIVNESFANRFYGSPADALGRRIGFGSNNPANNEIIGVVSDFRSVDLKDAQLINRTITPMAQGRLTSDGFWFYVSTVNDPLAHVRSVQRVVSELEPLAIVSDTRTLDRQIEIIHSSDVILARLSAAFAALATLLAAVGVYGITAFSVARRTPELGVRIAFGATRGHILSLVVGDLSRLLLAGAAAGTLLGLAVGRIVESQLFGISGGIDVPIFAGAVATLTLTTVLASTVPALRAVKIQPRDALGSE